MTRHPLAEQYNLLHLENMWMELVLDVVGEMVQRKRICACEECVLDLIALSMNQLPSKYWVSGKYNAFTPPETFLEDKDNRRRTREAVLNSIRQVRQNPHHL